MQAYRNDTDQPGAAKITSHFRLGERGGIALDFGRFISDYPKYSFLAFLPRFRLTLYSRSFVSLVRRPDRSNKYMLLASQGFAAEKHKIKALSLSPFFLDIAP